MMRLLFLLLFSTALLFGEDLAADFFNQGNRFYEKGRYDSALVCYDKVLSLGRHDSRVYYNKGNAHFRKKELGLAILNYEIARKLNPSDPDILDNLRFSYAARKDKIIPVRPVFVYRVVLFLHDFVSLRAQETFFLSLLFLTCGLFILFLFARPERRSRSLFFAVLFSGLLALCAVSLFVKIQRDRHEKRAVLLSPRADVRNEPDGGQILFSVHEGAVFKVERRIGTWVLGSLENGLSGWVPEDKLGMIEISE